MTPRMRVIAGPNGSGKSTLARQLMTDYEVNLYTFLNADDLFREIQARLKTPCPFSTDPAELLSFVEQSTYPDQFKAFFRTGKISISEADYIVFSPDAVNSYTVAITADFFKEQYLARKMSFSFETVFSHPAKIEILRRAFESGYRTYLYFIATESPEINIARIAERVQQGGHDVPVDKIRQRYFRGLDLVKSALPYLSRAYFFDNTLSSLCFAEYNRESGLIFRTDFRPRWFAKNLL